MLSQTTIDQIRFQTQLGVLPGRIRSNLDVEIGSTLFYDIRRSVIQEEKTEDLVQLIQFLRERNQKRIIVHDPNDTLELFQISARLLPLLRLVDYLIILPTMFHAVGRKQKGIIHVLFAINQAITKIIVLH